VLSNCQDADGLLICARESSIEPIRLVTIDPVTGESRTIFDPNPEFGAFRLGKVQRLYWKTAYGSESFGDPILPPDHREGERLPLIVTQYTTRGFLRGATGDQYPIFPFAARGFAVLSLDRPARWAEANAKSGDSRTWEQFERENNRDWIDRRNVLSSLMTGLKKVEELGVVDPRRIGITGTSEGAMGTWFALANTQGIFAAASMGSCCMDPKTLMAVGGEAWAKVLQESGYPSYRGRNDHFWTGISLAENVDRIKIPLLIQVPDDEYAMALETVTTYREMNRPVEFYVFPDEHHAIWQPAHRLAIYRRNLAWFERWLIPKVIERID
jgi:dipeptidyl aminopeptidase/acylaminoacyl peptidase